MRTEIFASNLRKRKISAEKADLLHKKTDNSLYNLHTNAISGEFFSKRYCKIAVFLG